jgi:AcrR family transcriptional regulator
MGRPRNADPSATKRRILTAAEAELEEVGALDLSTRAVARRAGVGVATVHSHFVDRQGLLDALIDQSYARLATAALSLRDDMRGAEPADIVEQAVRTGFRFGREHQTQMRALQVQVAANGGLDPRRQRGTQLPFLASIAAVLAPQLGLPLETVRLRMQSFQFVIGRWCLSSDDELRKLVGHDDIDVCVRRVEDHLVELAQSLLTSPGVALRARARA